MSLHGHFVGFYPLFENGSFVTCHREAVTPY
jgi:hypothetical protein